MFRGALEPWHLLVLVVLVALLFGGKRLPDAARGLGRSMRIFKSEVKQMRDEDRPAGERPADADRTDPHHHADTPHRDGYAAPADRPSPPPAAPTVEDRVVEPGDHVAHGAGGEQRDSRA